MEAFGVALDDYAYMADPSGGHSNAQNVEDRLKDQSMPPGGPFWTAAQLARGWIDERDLLASSQGQSHFELASVCIDDQCQGFQSDGISSVDLDLYDDRNLQYDPSDFACG